VTPRPRVRPRKSVWQRFRKRLIWIGVVVLASAAIYGLSLTSGVPYSDADLHGVDFSILNTAEKRTALQTANRARCTCGCGMTVAQCVATDSTCPIRTENLGRLRTMVADVVAARASS
jgi:hypothetical protein